MNRKIQAEKKNPLLSVIIVNYNVKEYLAQTLLSLERALKEIPSEVIVVDNASIDESVSYLRKHHRNVKIIENQENLGFGRANNQALKIARGKFVVLLNPDTVVQENTFHILLNFFSKTADAAAVTCKIINPDGTFSVDCRHSIPTPLIALWKVLGLSKLFPRSKIFGKYNLTYLDPDQTYQVPAISGSFMMIKRATLNISGFFDERFFMYCEDIDLCHRINKAGSKIYYVPETQIIHYKGESTKKNNLDYVRTFSKSLYLFFDKYYAPGSIFFFRWVVASGIFLRGILIYLKDFFKQHFPLILDFLILNGTILLAFVFRMELKRGFFWQDFFSSYFVINVIASALFLLISFYLDVYPTHRLSIQSIIKSNLVTFVFLAFLTFFLKQFAYSRLVILFTFIVSPALMIFWRIVLRKYFKGEKKVFGKDLFSKRTALVGNAPDSRAIHQKLQSLKDIDYEISGWIAIDDEGDLKMKEGLRFLGSLKHLAQIIKMHRIQQVIFSAKSLTYEQILKAMSEVATPAVEFKMVPSNREAIIGKSHIERLNDYPLLEIEYAIGKKFNRIVKRSFDLFLAGIIIFPTLPCFGIYFLFNRKKIKSIDINNGRDPKIQLFRFKGKSNSKLMDNWLLIWAVFLGKISFVGTPIFSRNQIPQMVSGTLYKPGLTGLVQINRNKIYSKDDVEKYHLFYMKNQSLLLDLEILFKAAWNRNSRG